MLLIARDRRVILEHKDRLVYLAQYWNIIGFKALSPNMVLQLFVVIMMMQYFTHCPFLRKGDNVVFLTILTAPTLMIPIPEPLIATVNPECIVTILLFRKDSKVMDFV